MRPRQRQSAITDLIRQHGRMSVDELTVRFSASAETIRRDLSVLARAGMIRKIHGGAALPVASSGEGSFRQRMSAQLAAKRLIAKLAASLIQPGDTLLIDTGTTTYVFAEEVAALGQLTVVTNSCEISRVIASAAQSNRVYLVGGAYQADNRETFGPLAIEQLRFFRARYAILGVAAVDDVGRALDFDVDEAHIARVLIEQAEKTVILADHTKFGRHAPFEVCALDAVEYLVSDVAPSQSLVSRVSACNVQLLHGASGPLDEPKPTLSV